MFTPSNLKHANHENTEIILHKNKLGTEYIIRNKTTKKNISSYQVVMQFINRTYLFTLVESYWLPSGKKCSQCTVLSRPTFFLKQEMNVMSRNYQKTMVDSLKTLFIYLALYDLKLEKMSYENCYTFISFLFQSTRCTYRECVFEENHKIDVDSVKTNLSAVKKYIKHLNLKNSHPFLDEQISKHAWYEGKSAESNARPRTMMDVNAKDPRLIRSYIKPEQYLRLRESKALSGMWSDTATVIIDLMMLHGLRIGEVFSLTLEDFFTYPSGKTVLILRNRQIPENSSPEAYDISCKNLPQIHNRDYGKKGYRCLCLDMQEIVLDKKCADEIKHYIDTYHKVINNKNDRQRYVEKNNADQIADYVPKPFEMRLADVSYSVDKKNHYLFMNTQYSRLLPKRWSQILKTLFEAENIPIDKEIKKIGLNHRFRHGYAMLLCRSKQKYNPLLIMKAMRHNSINSIMPYLQLTAEEAGNYNYEFTKPLLKIIEDVMEEGA